MAAIYETRRRWALSLDQSFHIPENVLALTESHESYVSFFQRVEDRIVIVVFGLAWYDNILIVSGSKSTSLSISSTFFGVLAELHIVVKGSSEDKLLVEDSKLHRTKSLVCSQRLDFEHCPGWSFSNNQGAYTGLLFSCQNGQFLWKHCMENVKDGSLLLQQGNRDLTARMIAEVVSVLLWDCQVSGAPLSFLVNELSIISEIGSAVAYGRSWDNPIQISDSNFGLLKAKLDAIVLADWRLRSSVPEVFRRSCFSGCGCQRCWRCVLSRGSVTGFEASASTLFRPWSPEESRKSINWRETVIALEWLEAFIIRRQEEMRSKRFLFVFAEDNTTAKCSLNSLYYTKCPEICGRLLLLFEVLGGSRISAIYYPTALQPADEPSRQKPVVCTEKVLGMYDLFREQHWT